MQTNAQTKNIRSQLDARPDTDLETFEGSPPFFFFFVLKYSCVHFFFSKRNTGFRTCRQNLLIVFCGLSKGNAKVEMIIAQKRLTNLNAIFILLNVSPRSFYFYFFFIGSQCSFFFYLTVLCFILWGRRTNIAKNKNQNPLIFFTTQRRTGIVFFSLQRP